MDDEVDFVLVCKGAQIKQRLRSAANACAFLVKKKNARYMANHIV